MKTWTCEEVRLACIREVGSQHELVADMLNALEQSKSDLLEALKVLLRNNELGEYESQQLGLPRMIEARDLARAAIKKAETL